MPTFTDGWTIGAPDAIFTMAEPFEVPAEGVVAYQYFQVPTNFAEDKWIQAIEVKAGDRSVVHHVIVFAFEPGAKRPRVLEFAPEQEPVKDQSKPAEERPAGVASERPPKQMGGPLVGVAPGTEAVVLKPGMARQLKAGTLLTFQMHYTTNGKAARDRSSVGFVFAKEPPATELRTAFFMNQRFVLPAGAKNERVDNWIGLHRRRQPAQPASAYPPSRHTVEVHAGPCRWPARTDPVGAEVRLQLADGVPVQGAAADREGQPHRSLGLVRQLR